MAWQRPPFQQQQQQFDQPQQQQQQFYQQQAFPQQQQKQQRQFYVPSPLEVPELNNELIRNGIGVGGRFFGNYVQGNINKLLAGQDTHEYFQVTEQYVLSKLKMILFPFLHRGHWMRLGEPTASGIAYKSPKYDINSPDLYIPLMAFSTYMVLRSFAVGIAGKFTTSVMSNSFSCGLGIWALELVLLKGTMFALGSVEAPWLDALAYSGYALVGLSLSMAASAFSKWVYYAIFAWTSICMAIFFVKTIKRVLLADARASPNSSMLLLIGIAQVPLFWWFTGAKL